MRGEPVGPAVRFIFPDAQFVLFVVRANAIIAIAEPRADNVGCSFGLNARLAVRSTRSTDGADDGGARRIDLDARRAGDARARLTGEEVCVGSIHIVGRVRLAVVTDRFHAEGAAGLVIFQLTKRTPAKQKRSNTTKRSASTPHDSFLQIAHAFRSDRFVKQPQFSSENLAGEGPS